MAWQTRGSRRYFYQSVRIGDRVERRYMKGEKNAVAAAEAIQQRLECRQEANRQIAAELKATREANRLSSLVEQRCELLMEAALLSQGFHKHNHGPWRLKRHASKN